MGFDICLGPESAFRSVDTPSGMRTLGAKTIAEGLNLAFPSHPGLNGGRASPAE